MSEKELLNIKSSVETLERLRERITALEGRLKACEELSSFKDGVINSLNTNIQELNTKLTAWETMGGKLIKIYKDAK